MPAIRPDQAEAFLRAPPRGVNMFLFHGEAEGLVWERSRALSKHLREREGADASLVKIDGDRLVSDPDAYTSDLYGISLFGGVRVLSISAGKRDLASALEPLTRQPSQDVIVIVEAGALKKDSALLALFTLNRNAASIECSVDTPADVGRFVDEQARLAGMKISEEARDALAVLLGSDRLSNRNELEKLFLYALGKESIGLDDLQAVVAGTEKSPLDELLDDALSGKLKSPRDAIPHFVGDPADLQSFPYRLVTQLLALLIIGEDMAQGQSFQQAMREVQWRVKSTPFASLQNQAQRWRPQAVKRLLPVVVKLLARSRQHGKLSGILMERFFWNLITQAR
jgi:DNA polymerase-3 subunit delta